MQVRVRNRLVSADIDLVAADTCIQSIAAIAIDNYLAVFYCRLAIVSSYRVY